MKDFFKRRSNWIILCLFLVFFFLGIFIGYNIQPNLYKNEYFNAKTYVKVQKVFDMQTGVYYYITSTGDITVAVDVYGRPLIVDGGDGTADFDLIRGENPYAAQQ